MNIRMLEAADNPHTPSWQLGAMALFVADATIATAVAQNLNTPKWAASMLAAHKSPTVREALAGRCGLGNRFLSTKARQRLMHDGNANVRDRVELSTRGEWPPEWMSVSQPESSVFG